MVSRAQHGDDLEDYDIQAQERRPPVGDCDHRFTSGSEYPPNFVQCLLVGLQVFNHPQRHHHVKSVVWKWNALDVPDPESGRAAKLPRMADHGLSEIDTPHGVSALDELCGHQDRKSVV